MPWWPADGWQIVIFLSYDFVISSVIWWRLNASIRRRFTAASTMQFFEMTEAVEMYYMKRVCVTLLLYTFKMCTTLCRFFCEVMQILYRRFLMWSVTWPQWAWKLDDRWQIGRPVHQLFPLATQWRRRFYFWDFTLFKKPPSFDIWQLTWTRYQQNEQRTCWTRRIYTSWNKMVVWVSTITANYVGVDARREHSKITARVFCVT